MKAVSEACLHPENYHYSLGETEELLEAVIHRYKKRYYTDIAKNEIMSVYGSQEGMAHIFLPLINPGDIVLLPNPGYPIFSTGAFIAQSNQWFYPLTEENNYLPDFDAIPQDVKEAAKIMVVSYPANPICKTAPDEFYEKLIAFAKENNILLFMIMPTLTLYTMGKKESRSSHFREQKKLVWNSILCLKAIIIQVQECLL